jgi:hypothetical protein
VRRGRTKARRKWPSRSSESTVNRGRYFTEVRYDSYCTLIS